MHARSIDDPNDRDIDVDIITNAKQNNLGSFIRTIFPKSFEPLFIEVTNVINKNN